MVFPQEYLRGCLSMSIIEKNETVCNGKINKMENHKETQTNDYVGRKTGRQNVVDERVWSGAF